MAFAEWSSPLPPSSYAREIQYKLKMNTLPINLQEVARYIDVSLEYAELDSLAGVYFAHERLIVVSDKISNEQRRRFTIAHELGHAYIPGHDDIMFSCKEEDVRNYQSSKRHEREANIFASELLMPSALVETDVRRLDMTFDSAEKIAEKYGVSLTAAMLKLVEVSEEPGAVVLSQAGRIKWSNKSASFEGHVKQSATKLDENTYAVDLFREKSESEKRDVALQNAWIIGTAKSTFIREHSRRLGSLDMVLTLLTPYQEETES